MRAVGRVAENQVDRTSSDLRVSGVHWRRGRKDIEQVRLQHSRASGRDEKCGWGTMGHVPESGMRAQNSKRQLLSSARREPERARLPLPARPAALFVRRLTPSVNSCLSGGDHLQRHRTDRRMLIRLDLAAFRAMKYSSRTIGAPALATGVRWSKGAHRGAPKSGCCQTALRRATPGPRAV